MIGNYFKIAWRNLWKHKTFSAIIVFGMAVALAAGLLLSLTAYHELTYDQFHVNKEHLYQVYLEEHTANGINKSSTLPTPLTPALKAEYSDIVRISRYGSGIGELVRYKDRELDLTTRAVDPDFLNMFSFPVVSGNRQAPLNDLGDVVITEYCAKKLFGNEEAVGKTIEMKLEGQWRPMRVSAVLQDFPTNSSFEFDLITRFENFPEYYQNKDSWDDSNHDVFVQLEKTVTQAAIEKRLPAFSHKYMAEKIKNYKRDGGRPDPDGEFVRLRLIPVTDIHFSDISSVGAGVSRFYPYLLLIISAFILFIACVNFVNLSLARSFTRAKEIGIRKVMGALRWQLISQFWGEALIICLLALIVGTGIAYVILPYYKSTFYQAISPAYLLSPAFLAWLVTGFVFITLLAGGYPAWVISAFNTVKTVKGKLTTGNTHYLRNTLMVVQFVLSSLLIICTFVVWQQLSYLRNKPLGYSKEEVISIPLGQTMDSEKAISQLRTRLASDPGVMSVTATDINIGRGRDGSSQSSKMGFDYKERSVKTHWQLADYDYIKTMGIPLVAGRDFSREYGSDSTCVLINEQMAKLLGEKDPLGVMLPVDSGQKYQVIGVIKDFHFKSLHQAIDPLTISIKRDWALEYAFVRVRPGNLAASLDKIQKAWKEVDPQSIFEASYLDENTNRQYRKEERMSKIFISGAVLAILISCMGLFAIVLLVIVQRTREIGIRKVLGAGVPHIVALVSKDFIKLVLLAIVIASPIAWYVMNQWLQDFAYRIDIAWWVFVLAGIVAVLIAMLTLGFQSIKAALSNPVKSLRSE